MPSADPGHRADGTIILICGLPGSGKATLARQLERERRALRLGEDEWMVQLFGSTDGRGESERERIKEAQWQIAVRVARLGFDVVLDWGLWSRQERDEYRTRAAAAGVRTDLRFLDVSRSELASRLAARNAALPPETFPVTEQELDLWWELFERPTPEELGQVSRQSARRSKPSPGDEEAGAMSDQHDELDPKRESAYEALARDLEARVNRVIQSSLETFARRLAELEERVAALEQSSGLSPGT